jgi:hypothetical protein
MRPGVEADLPRREQRSLAALAWAWPKQTPPPSVTTPHESPLCNPVGFLGRESDGVSKGGVGSTSKVQTV